MQKVWGDKSVALMLIAAVAACVRFEPGPLSPEQITSNFESRTADNPKLKEFLGTNLNRKFFNWPASPWDFSRLTPAALNYHQELDVARAKQISTDTK
jgi:cobalt-zinc-cadmium efflux system outer membrane protein